MVCLSLMVVNSRKANRARLDTPRLPDFHRPGPPWVVSGRVRHRRPAGSLVPCTGGTGTTVLWFPARAVRARPFSSSQHGRSVAWRRSAVLLQAKEEEEEDRGEKIRREEKRREERSCLELIEILSWAPTSSFKGQSILTCG